VTLLIADDDQDDRYMIREALEESRVTNDIRFVVDGEELMDYLLRRGRYRDPGNSPRPGLILLDLNMPKKDGREALREIRAHAELSTIPVVVLTTSKTEEDILRSHELGASAFISKPVTFEGLVESLRDIGQYWVQIVELPEPVLP
jgi:CheY-like chemotaxis protein